MFTIYDKTIMLDCSQHMIYQDNLRFRNLIKLVNLGKLGSKYVKLALITHFHFDHCGALSDFTELYANGNNEPVLMFMPTKSFLAYKPKNIEEFGQ